MIAEPSGGWWVAAGFLAASVILIFAIVRAAGWGGRKATSPATGVQSAPAIATPAAPPTSPPPAGNSGSGGAAKSSMRIPWGWLRFAAIALAVIFVWQYAWPQWIKPWWTEHALLQPQAAGNTARTTRAARSETIVYHRQVPEGGTVVAPSQPGAWSESITYRPGLNVCTVEPGGAESVAAEMKILGSAEWLPQESLSGMQRRRVDQLRLRSLNGVNQSVAFYFVPFGERC